MLQKYVFSKVLFIQFFTLSIQAILKSFLRSVELISGLVHEVISLCSKRSVHYMKAIAITSDSMTTTTHHKYKRAWLTIHLPYEKNGSKNLLTYAPIALACDDDMENGLRTKTHRTSHYL